MDTCIMKLNDLTVESIDFEVARDLISSNHYLHSLPSATKFSYGLFSPETDSIPLGAVTYGACVNRHAIPNLFPGSTAADGLELTRLWAQDGLPKFSVGRLVSHSLRHLPQVTDRRIILTYVDSSRFEGTVFRATNWIHAGMTRGGRWHMFLDGKWYHPRTARTQWGTDNVGYLQEVYGPRLKVTWVEEGKHIFLYLLGSTREKKQLREALCPSDQ
jgi:hypothetical protein